MEQSAWETSAKPALYYFFELKICLQYPKYLCIVFIYIYMLHAFIVLMWNYLTSSLWMLIRSHKQLVIKFYMQQPEGLILQSSPVVWEIWMLGLWQKVTVNFWKKEGILCYSPSRLSQAGVNQVWSRPWIFHLHHIPHSLNIKLPTPSVLHV